MFMLQVINGWENYDCHTNCGRPPISTIQMQIVHQKYHANCGHVGVIQKGEEVQRWENGQVDT